MRVGFSLIRVLGMISLGAALGACLPQSPPLTVTAPTGESSSPSLFVQGISSSSNPVKSRTWNFTCSTIPCRFRVRINQNPSHSFSSLEGYGAPVNSQSVTQPGGDGVYYLHVQAKDTSENESAVRSVYAVLDNTAPEFTGLADDPTMKSVLSWSWGCSESIPCQYRFVVDQQESTTPTTSYSSTTTRTVTGAGGRYYLHIQARDQAGNESPVQHYFGELTVSSYKISGRVVFDWVPAVKAGAEDTNGIASGRINYTGIQQLPGRRLLIQALRSSDSSVLSTTATNDAGDYELYVPIGESVKVRLAARIQASGYSKDGVAGSLEGCDGASWDVRIVDNTQNRAQYVMTTTSTYSSASIGVNFTPQTTFNAGTGLYTARGSAPFALLDSIIRQIELVCQSEPGVSLPLVYVNWSPANVAESPGSADNDRDGTLDDKERGKIATSHYTVENVGGVDRPNVYILGKEDSDTDEFDDHVVAHEFGHYLEDQLYRSDSIGGSHSIDHSLDPRVAFGEGYGNAISGMTFNNPVYVDTSGDNQASGFSMNVSTPPKTLSRGVYSERSAQYFLWSLFVNRSSSYDRIHSVLTDHKTSPAMTSLHSFASYYRARFGASSDGFSALWSSALSSPLNALCVGSCPSDASGAPDLFDGDGDLGGTYASTLKYPATSSGSAKSAAFWNLYVRLTSGARSTARETTLTGGYGYPYNKMGMNRWYLYRATSDQVVTVRISAVAGLTCPTNSRDALDLVVFQAGQVIAADETGSGCPVVSFSTTSGQDYVVIVSGYQGETTSYTITVSP